MHFLIFFSLAQILRGAEKQHVSVRLISFDFFFTTFFYIDEKESFALKLAGPRM
jgi:hypothetical protein